MSELRSIGEHVYDDVLAARIRPGVRALAQRHLEDGQRVWLVTAGPIDLAAPIARGLGLTGALGTVAEEVDGTYTGELVGPPLHGPAKADAVRALAAREGLDLARCAAYSDSVHDLPLLSLVGRPRAVNPDARLRAHARARGWPVHEFGAGRLPFRTYAHIRRRTRRLAADMHTSAGGAAGQEVASQRRR